MGIDRARFRQACRVCRVRLGLEALEASFAPAPEEFNPLLMFDVLLGSFLAAFISFIFYFESLPRFGPVRPGMPSRGLNNFLGSF
jgi:hypothetical protein